MHLLFSAESPSVSWTKGVHISSVQQRSEFLSRERTHSSRSRGFSAAFPVYPLRSEVWSLAFVGGGVGEGLWDTFSSSLSRQSKRHRQEAVSELSHNSRRLSNQPKLGIGAVEPEGSRVCLKVVFIFGCCCDGKQRCHRVWCATLYAGLQTTQQQIDV